MNTLILNRDTFQMPDDGWYQIAPVGEFPHSGAGVVQVVDRAACEAMAAAFQADSVLPNFAGLLIDFDHFSLDGKQKSEAAGWIVDLEARDPKAEIGKAESKNEAAGNAEDFHREDAKNAKVSNAGLWAKIRWSDAGEACVRGGRYRFISPVWARADCEDLGDGRVRPVRLLNAAVTNDPNMKGMVPLSNRRSEDGGQRSEDLQRCENAATKSTEDTKGVVANASPAPVRLKWVLGDADRHCPSCVSLAGQVHSAADWAAAGLSPGSSGLYCQAHCHCSLVETDEPEAGSLAAAVVRAEVANRRGKTADCRLQTADAYNAGDMHRKGAKDAKDYNAEGNLVDFSASDRERTQGPHERVQTEMEGLMDTKADGGKTVEELANSLRLEQEKNQVLLDQVVVLEDELVNRSMSEFENVVSEQTREFWKQQLISNREGALAALNELRAAKLPQTEREAAPPEGEGRQPLHNRGGKVRQGSATGGEAGRTAVVDGVAARIRNRAHELCKAEGVPFSVAFRRAEREAQGASRD